MVLTAWILDLEVVQFLVTDLSYSNLTGEKPTHEVPFDSETWATKQQIHTKIGKNIYIGWLCLSQFAGSNFSVRNKTIISAGKLSILRMTSLDLYRKYCKACKSYCLWISSPTGLYFNKVLWLQCTAKK